MRTLLWGRIDLGKALACSEPLTGVGELEGWTPVTGICLRAYGHLHKESWDVPLAAVNAHLTDGPWEEAELWKSSSSFLPGLAWLPPERAVSTLSITFKYQTPCSELQLEVSSLNKTSIICLVCFISSHSLGFDRCPALSFYSCVFTS